MCVKIWRVFHICDRKYRFEINFCVDDLYVFVYGSAGYATTSLECTKVKLLILNNFALIYKIRGDYNIHIFELNHFLETKLSDENI